MPRETSRPCGRTDLRVALRSAIAVTGTTLFTPASPASAQTTDFTFTQYGTYYTIPGGPARVWLPEAGTPLRGLMVFDNFAGDNTAANPFGKDPTAITSYRDAAKAMGFGLLTTPKSFDGLSAAKTQQTIDGLLNSAAAATGRGQVANLPIVPIGFSGGGNDALRVGQRYPSRVITYVANRIAGEVVTEQASGGGFINGAQPGWQNLAGLYLAGAVDRNERPSIVSASVMKGGPNNGITFTPAGSAVRERGGLAALGVLPERGHSDDHAVSPLSEGYEFSMYWIARNATARLAGTAVASTTPGNPVALTALSKANGWLADADRYAPPADVYTTGSGTDDTRASTSAFKPIAAYADYAGDKEAASWMVDADLAFAYRAALSDDGGHPGRNSLRSGTPLLFSAIAPLQSFTQGDTASLAIDPRDFDDVNAITKMDFYDGATLLGSDTSATGGWGIDVQLTATGVRGLNVIAYRQDDQVRAGFRAISVQAAAVPEPSAVALLGLAATTALRRPRASANESWQRDCDV